MEHFMKEAKRIMLEGKFELRCWVTGPVISDEEVVTTSILDLMWDPRTDELFSKPMSPKSEITKRYLLSVAQSIFDPLGFLCPVTIVSRQIIQKCWIMYLSWDQTLVGDLVKTFKEWLHQLDILNMCRIPRRLSRFNLSLTNNSLHIFCDGSQTAYACCIFLRTEYQGEVDMQLVMAKSRVASTKAITIPRLELTAALIAARLSTEVKSSLELPCQTYLLLDRFNYYIGVVKEENRTYVFVHNRVIEILERTSVDDWRHIPGDLNPADLPSRGCNPKALIQSKWWLGPEWLRRPNRMWPESREIANESEVAREFRGSHCLTVQIDNAQTFSNRLLYFRAYSKLIRMIGWCLRFSKAMRPGKELSMNEIMIAEERVLKCHQKEYLNDEFIKQMNVKVFEDEKGILRVKTRLSLSGDTEGFVYPILLRKYPIVERLVEEKHKKYLHAGSQTLIAKLREHYWIIGCRTLVKRVIKKCIICRRFIAKSCNTPIPPLPANRVSCGSPFEVTGVDFAGPLILRSGEKCWIALFTCAVYRAVHLELCSSLSTEAFMLALRRFLARRGTVRTIYSDNGTNFQGAKNVFESLNWEKIGQSVERVEWRFSPPAAPWWGGFWERMVRTIKEILRRILGKAILTFNEIQTVLCEVEAIVNSRPLTYITESTENLQPLTPASFLLFPKSSNTNNIDIESIDGSILTARWRYIKKLCSDLKQRFRSEYLALLAEKPTPRKYVTVEPGDVVLVEVGDKKRVEWPLGLVIEVLDDVDGHNRVARIKTATGERLRALRSLYSLELHCVDVSRFIKKSNVCPSEELLLNSNRPLPVVTRSGRLVKIPERFNI